ncbi:MAG: hypothetical protein ABR955_04970 [Verrucomicrobiota bacterium]|jgi:hypothetical protein
MNFDFQRILKRAGLLMGEMQPIKSGMVAVPAAKPVANGQIGLNCVTTTCERMTFAHFRGWVSKNPIQPNPTQSNLIQPNPTKKMAWTTPVWFKAVGMEARNS